MKKTSDKMTWISCLIAIVASSLFGACTYMPHEVKLDAKVPPVGSHGTLGKGVKLNFSLVDDRDQLSAGLRGTSGISADVKVADIMNYLTEQLTLGFKNRGFVLVPQSQTADASVAVYLRSFRWFSEAGFWTRREDVFVSIRVDAKNRRTGGEYLNTYQHDRERKSLYEAFGDEIDKNLNFGLEDVLEQLFTDFELMRVLTAKVSSE